MAGYDPYLCANNQNYARANKFSYYTHIDLYLVYCKPLIRSIIYENRYKDLGLNSVCKAVLGEGKYQNLDGLQIQKLSKEEQLQYVSQDAKLLMNLSKHNNFKILDLMNAISIVIGVTFEKVCHTGVSAWWKKIIDDMIFSGCCRWPNRDIKKRKYTGGHVIEPKVAFYDKQQVYVLDVKSLYPSMMIAHNISFETVNCQCRNHDPNARVSNEIMNIVNSGLPESEKRSQYWICRNSNYVGVYPGHWQHF